MFESRVSPSVAELWFKNLTPLAFRRGTVWLGAPNEVVRDYVDSQYRREFEQVFRELTGSPVSVRIEVSDYLPRALPSRPGDSQGSNPLGPSNGTTAFEKRNGFVPLKSAGKNIGLARTNADTKTERKTPPSFVVRPENKTCYGILKRTLREPLPVFNPIFVYGPSGVGKTALLRWFLRSLSEERELRPAVLDGEGFMRRFTRSLRQGTIDTFRGDLVSKEVLVLDEAHRLADRPATQREFDQIMRHYLDRNRQVVLLSRHHPRDILRLDAGLQSYFMSGMVAAMSELSVPSRTAILEDRAKRFRKNFSHDAIEAVAGQVPGGLSAELDLLKRGAALASLSKEEVTAEFLRDRFPELKAKKVPDEVLTRALECICRQLDVKREDVLGGSKARRIALARHLTIYVASTMFGFSARRIGRSLGTVSPSVVPYAKKRIESLRKEDAKLDAVLKTVRREIDFGQQWIL